MGDDDSPRVCSCYPPRRRSAAFSSSEENFPLFLSLSWLQENLPVGRESENREPIRDKESLERETGIRISTPLLNSISISIRVRK